MHALFRTSCAHAIFEYAFRSLDGEIKLHSACSCTLLCLPLRVLEQIKAVATAATEKLLSAVFSQQQEIQLNP